MESRGPVGDSLTGRSAALAMLLWTLAGGLVLVASLYPCIGSKLCGPGTPQYAAGTRYALGTWLLVVMGAAILSTLGAIVGTILVAGHSRDWLAAGGLLVLGVISCVALYALRQEGRPGHTPVDYFYGFSPQVLDLH